MILTPDDFAEEQGDSPVYRTPMEGGLPKQLAKSSRVLVVRSVKYFVKTKADKISWDTFVRTTLRNGADWFNWTDPVDTVVKLARIPNGKYRAEPWTPTLSHWHISFSIETWSA
jgi:hypothetical protein